jgi:hypothetical protein
MSIKSSLPTVADQIISYNKTIIEILSKINSLTTTTEQSILLKTYDENNNLRTYAMPSFNGLKADIERLNNNINSLYNIDSTGSIIQPTNQNEFKKIITVNLNQEPNDITGLGVVTKFKSSNNLFFEELLNPSLMVEFDLNNKIDNNVGKILSRRYIVNFEKNETGDYTDAGKSALNSFNSLFRGNSSISITDLENWHRTTPGVINPDKMEYDEQIYDVAPNELLYEGLFSVLSIQEDSVNKKLWYVLDTLTYLVRTTNETSKLAINDELVINVNKSSTRYKIIEVSTAATNPRVRLERIEGVEAIPVGVSTLKLYSPIYYNKKIKIGIGYNERNIIFIKSLNTNNNLLSKNWSLGTGFYSNDLVLESTTSDNGLSMQKFYIDYVYDYGTVLKDLVLKKIPNTLSVKPNPPTLNINDFKVVQINTHLTDSLDTESIKQKYNYQSSLKSEVEQLQNAIDNRNAEYKYNNQYTTAEKKQLSLELDELANKKNTKSKLLESVTQEIISLSSNYMVSTEPKFRLRGFWKMPDPIDSRSTWPQEIVQFRIQYRYLSKDGNESQIETYNISGTQNKAAFSNWNEYKTEVRKRVYDSVSNTYIWQKEEVEKSDEPNINQLDIPIQANEKVEFRIKSITEVGWPECPVESDWSSIITYEFPDELNNIVNENENIIKSSLTQDLLSQVNRELTSKRVYEHISDMSESFHHDSSNIFSGVIDSNGIAMSLFDYFVSLQNRISSLEEKIDRINGILEVYIIRNNEELIVNNRSETIFTIECEDYLQPYLNPASPGRTFANNIYVIKDFSIVIKNKSTSSSLGLLSNRTYLQNPDCYNTGAPQTFWVNDQDELITSDTTGQSRTHLDNQFIWSINYDSISTTSVSKLSENIGNSFITNKSNSITNILSSSEYNIGFNESSVLSFVGENKSLIDTSKWLDKTTSVSSTEKFLSTIHPVIPYLETIVENNSDKVKTLEKSTSLVIPINIYFKMNSLDNSQIGKGFDYIDLNSAVKTTKHVKKLKFLLENESDNKPFIFTIKFILNRNKIAVSNKTSDFKKVSFGSDPNQSVSSDTSKRISSATKTNQSVSSDISKRISSATKTK